MEFSKNKSIYMQIADYFYANILLEYWKVDEKVPSVRQLAVDIEVNPNTVMRTYSMLQEKNIIYNQRGIGFFVSKEAKQIVKNLVKEQFISTKLPEMFDAMELLGMDISELSDFYNKWKSNL